MEYGSEYDWLSNKDFITAHDSGFVRPDWQLYRSGRDALKAFARMAGRRKVLLPALCCESMVLPFTQNGYEHVFYRISEVLGADEADVWAKLEPGCVLLYMRYFGIDSLSDAFLQRVRDRGDGILIIEDRTHDILCTGRAQRFRPDAVAASLRKWTALPDGGMLVTALGRGEGMSDGRFAAIRRKAMEEKSCYLENGDAALKAHYMHEIAAAAELLDESPMPVKMGAAEEEHLRRIDFEAMLRRRQDNALYLQERLRPLAERGLIKFMCPRPEDSTLYFCITLEDRDKLHQGLIAQAIYAAVIWPLVDGAGELCPVTAWLNRHMLAIPCDHRCRREDMDFIANSVFEILGE